MSRKRGQESNLTIPNRWLYCPRKASSLIGDKFIAFKTPLDSKYDSQVGDECLFHPQTMISATQNILKRKLGLWIDLTNTSRFYDSKTVEKMGCKYIKLNCKGHGETPSVETVQIFIETCSDFISKHADEVIGVHCTHGFNRTGFLIVSFLVTELDWSVEAAVAEFAKVRPPGIYKQEYILELFKQYGDVEDCPAAPSLPMWHSESDDTGHGQDDDEVEVEASGSNGEPVKKKRKEGNQMKAIFMDGIPNVRAVVDMDVVTVVQNRIKKLTGFTSNGFPGCQPVSMDRRNISLLESQYMVSWKADGTRYMMYIQGASQVYFIDRDNAVFQMDGVSFVSSSDRSRHLIDTLVDGEMVIDTEVGGKQIPRYLIYDLISLEGQKNLLENFQKRHRTIQKEIIDPRIKAMEERRIHREREPIGIRRKEFWGVDQTAYLLGDKFRDKLGHEPDGLIFQPVDDPYTPGPCQAVLKWKPPSHNSVDFRVKYHVEDRTGYVREKLGLLYVGGQTEPFAQIKASKIKGMPENAIVECRFDKPTNQWVFMRQRTDKSFPNSYNTAKAVCQSILEPVDNDYLTHFIETHSPGSVVPTIMAPPRRPPPRRPH